MQARDLNFQETLKKNVNLGLSCFCQNQKSASLLYVLHF